MVKKSGEIMNVFLWQFFLEVSVFTAPTVKYIYGMVSDTIAISLLEKEYVLH